MANTFGARLLRAWVDKGLPPPDLPALIGMTSAEFERCEIDKSQPHLESLQKLSAALSVEAGWLLNGDEYFATETLAQMREQTGYLRELRDMARAQAEQSRLSGLTALD